ncbi:hypothetical protein A2697_02310 [Candidatus Curtissbacteria bacterium RIFCSPHIGHO2_01_FULL_41_44]|uniref:Uncharacterized protein n=1 Tax=Candidatus Curtissbacteria bacterium RIFCSPLOWO2_01_FULL_42_50 TaxID=1797730 RepID=A0A1F5H811_9BACT|nr:MAG: hypothetical protein A3C33_01475 [Candidatus Curtissbacteria bacterium RIFCSPHIGHO2_02_FULL_42_58]OGD94704.1 MAG: hypothetical protein A2697_02310 [Candidatus Curtissbacteria bacterium RIFCSPHIGHO2_01_FULL_41_44]OGD97011.1 MAG: hypothetical protein A3E71_01565 [Candidatus Curtissbacteria bacterium RIFCSPHIGHO2_12_FULL_42_33]OGE00219.1 MAG: hypothetical protein A3B54_02555 [Candidatus Curtissbacteria bacterium RIFCSPLOWO2_01_FULL_42_50]OGE02640.1 MAG: hypothetical protein A3G16_01395 [Ca
MSKESGVIIVSLKETEQNTKWFSKRERDLRRLVHNYVDQLRIIEDNPVGKLLHIPPPIEEQLIRSSYADANRGFDNKLASLVNKLVTTPGGTDAEKARIVRWACATTVSSLMVQETAFQIIGRKSLQPQIIDSIRLTARRVIVYGARKSAELEGSSIEQEWLDQICRNILENSGLPLEKFVNDPPKVNL